MEGNNIDIQEEMKRKLEEQLLGHTEAYNELLRKHTELGQRYNQLRDDYMEVLEQVIKLKKSEEIYYRSCYPVYNPNNVMEEWEEYYQAKYDLYSSVEEILEIG